MAEQLNEREMYYISLYDTYNNGYNLTIGGQKNENTIVIEDIKRRISTDLRVTERQWAVYFYLLSKSEINRRRPKDPMRIYRNSINISGASKMLGMDRSTFYNALKALNKHKLIDNTNKDYILMDLPESYATIPKNLLTQLLYFRKKLSIDLLRTYLFFVITYTLYPLKEFTTRNIVRCLGHSDHNEEYYTNVGLYLDLLSKWDLIEYTSKVKLTEFGDVRLYKVKRVYYESNELNNRFANLKAEIYNDFGLTDEEEQEIIKKLEK